MFRHSESVLPLYSPVSSSVSQPGAHKWVVAEVLCTSTTFICTSVGFFFFNVSLALLAMSGAFNIFLAISPAHSANQTTLSEFLFKCSKAFLSPCVPLLCPPRVCLCRQRVVAPKAHFCPDQTPCSAARSVRVTLQTVSLSTLSKTPPETSWRDASAAPLSPSVPRPPSL